MHCCMCTSLSNHLIQQTEHHLRPVLNIINRTCGSSQPAYHKIKGKSFLRVKKTNLINSALSSETYKKYFSAKVKSTTSLYISWTHSSTVSWSFLKHLDFFNRSCRKLTLNFLKNNLFCN